MRSRVRFPVLPWEFSLQGKIPVVTMVWLVSRFRLKAPPGIASSCISPLTSSGQCSRTSWEPQPHTSATLSPQPAGKPRKFIRTCGDIGGGGILGSQCAHRLLKKKYLRNQQIMRSQLTEIKCVQRFCAKSGHMFCAKFGWFGELTCKNYNNCYT